MSINVSNSNGVNFNDDLREFRNFKFVFQTPTE